MAAGHPTRINLTKKSLAFQLNLRRLPQPSAAAILEQDRVPLGTLAMSAVTEFAVPGVCPPVCVSTLARYWHLVGRGQECYWDTFYTAQDSQPPAPQQRMIWPQTSRAKVKLPFSKSNY